GTRRLALPGADAHGDASTSDAQRPASGDNPVAVSRRNLEAHERAVAAVNAREVPEGLLAPDFRMENRVSAATDYVYRGERGWREWLSDLFESFADGACYAVEEIVAAGEDFVAARFLLSGTGARTHEPLELRWVGVT